MDPPTIVSRVHPRLELLIHNVLARIALGLALASCAAG